MDAHVVPPTPFDPHAVVALPEAPARTLRDHAIEHMDHGGVALSARLGDSIERRPRQSHDATGSLDRQAVFGHDHLCGLALHGRRHSFRESTSLIAAFSSASSAYMRLSFAFSASSSFIRFSSLTDTPA